MSTLLRLATAGSVDDGKSTLVGRLLHDSKAVLADQLAAIERASTARGLGAADLALLTDGLRAEREQGITIDVAYRYFATARRSFILADCPGHVQYTRNTVTGASTADAIVLLVDVRHGIVEQTRRHLAVAALLRVPHVVVAVNKVDLVDYAQGQVDAVAAQVADLAAHLGIADARCVPVSALVGDNVVDRSPRMPWYDGPALLALLEELPVGDDAGLPFRMPVQLAIRPQQAAARADLVEFRGLAGRVATGEVRIGEPVVILPSERRTHVSAIHVGDREVVSAVAGDSVTVSLADDVDVSRGDIIAAAEAPPVPVKEISAVVAWLSTRPLRPRDRIVVKHGTRTTQALVTEIVDRLDIDSMHPTAAESLSLNDIGEIRLRVADALPVEPYAVSRHTGSFLLIDPQEGATLAAGMIGGSVLGGAASAAGGRVAGAPLEPVP